MQSVVAPVGIVTTICVADVETIEAATPLKVAVAPDKLFKVLFVEVMVTVVPTVPEVGETVLDVTGQLPVP